MSPRTIIIYHAECPDGFGGAYAAWKKFGDKAEYRPKRHGEEPPTDLAGAEVFMIDFSYPIDVLQKIEKEAARLVVLDHHVGAQAAVESIREHIFDNDRSGATIAWGYFHPEETVPRLLEYVTDGDLWRFALPFAKEIAVYITTLPFQFERWDAEAAAFDDPERFKDICVRGGHYAEYFDSAVGTLARDAELVEFEGYRVYACEASRIFHSAIGHLLAERQPPLSITYRREPAGWRISLRGDGSVNCDELAKRHGGGGHHNASGFQIQLNTPFPFTPIQK